MIRRAASATHKSLWRTELTPLEGKFLREQLSFVAIRDGL